MNIEEIREYCLSKVYVSESFPFDQTNLVFKVFDKMFLLISIETKPLIIAVKAKPEKCIEQREEYSCVVPAYHFNKTHWNNIIIDGSVSEMLVKQWIDESYLLVASKLTKEKKKLIF